MTDPNQTPVTPPSSTPPPAPQFGPPASSTPPPAPQFGQAPPYGAPAYGAPAYGAPAYGAPAYGAPVYGAPAPEPYGAPASSTDRYNVLAIVSLVTAFFFQLVAIITGHIALSQIKKTGEKGRGLAIAGLVIGYVSIALGIILAAIFIPLYLTLLSDPNFVNDLNY